MQLRVMHCSRIRFCECVRPCVRGGDLCWRFLCLRVALAWLSRACLQATSKDEWAVYRKQKAAAERRRERIARREEAEEQVGALRCAAAASSNSSFAREQFVRARG
jgi:hypothetical protein